MSKRFTAFNSKYIKRTKHQNINGGKILERDWPTTNGLSVLRFGSGRKAFYNSGNFVFTTSNIPTYHKKHKLTLEKQKWDWDKCKDADGTVNDVKPNFLTNDIRNYAYYGSCAELIRSTIEEIIMDFPGRIVTSKNTFSNYPISGYILTNDFNIDLHHKTVSLGKYDNPLRFMSNSWQKYCIKTENYECGCEDNISYFEIGQWMGDLTCPANDEGQNVVNVTFVTEANKKYIIKGYSIVGKIIYVYEGTDYFALQPQRQFIDEYFMSLKGFKAQLLRKDTNPLYTNKLKTPVEFRFKWFYPEKVYTWPSSDYCIDINSIAFSSFCDAMFDMGNKMDELWTDNIYRSMTHETIKNFDWTYSRDYYEDDAQDNIDGGERMMKLLRICGRVFDDAKFYIDNIKQTKNITYDKINNCPEALLSDKVQLDGTDIISTISPDFDINTVITNDYLTQNVTKDISWCDSPRTSTHKKWYQNRNCEDLFPDVCDNELMRRFSLSLKHVMRTKGTQQAIDMIMAFFGFGRNPFAPSSQDDYIITEEAFYTKKIIPYNECVDGKNKFGEQVGEDWTKNDKYPVSWANIESTTKGDVLSEINAYKIMDRLYYGDPYSGIPLQTILVGHKCEPFIVPYFDKNVVYDGNIAFQEGGGWGKFISLSQEQKIDEKFTYLETMSYLHVVGNIGEMLSINPNTLNIRDIYYVVNLSDYTKYDENPPHGDNMTMSHFFVLMNMYEPYMLSSWKNIVIDTSSTDDNFEMANKTDFQKSFGDDEHADWFYDEEALRDAKHGEEPTEEEKMSVYTYCFKHLLYLNSIISTNVGNNPHVGYGKYDDGNKFIEYMKKPFKYTLDNSQFTDFNHTNIAEMLSFDDITDNMVSDKIQIFGYTKNGDGYLVTHNNANGDTNTDGKIWYINTKVLTITNNVKENKSNDGDDSLYLRYFKNIILPYIMQVIPSTTILKLKGF